MHMSATCVAHYVVIVLLGIAVGHGCMDEVCMVVDGLECMHEIAITHVDQ